MVTEADLPVDSLMTQDPCGILAPDTNRANHRIRQQHFRAPASLYPQFELEAINCAPRMRNVHRTSRTARSSKFHFRT